MVKKFKIKDKLGKILLAKAKLKKFKHETPVVSVNQKTYDIIKDERRFFKEELEEDKRRLFLR